MRQNNNIRVLRDTKQRSAIKRAFEETGRPLGPKEILEVASHYVPRLGNATVYRNIKVMLEQGELEPVNIPGQPPRYYPPTERNRPLFVCTRTNRVYYLNVDTSSVEGLPPDDFLVDHHQVIFYGVCPEFRQERMEARVAQFAS